MMVVMRRIIMVVLNQITTRDYGRLLRRSTLDTKKKETARTMSDRRGKNKTIEQVSKINDPQFPCGPN